ncbi:hypothetical protein ACP4OV_001064 [Aristida adscensionis]
MDTGSELVDNDITKEELVRGVNWVPNSSEEEDVVLCSQTTARRRRRQTGSCMAVGTDLADSGHADDGAGDVRAEEHSGDEVDVTQALLQLLSTEVSKFDTDKHMHEVSNFMLPVLLPSLYGKNDDDVYDAAVTLLWLGRGFGLVHQFSNEELEEKMLQDQKVFGCGFVWTSARRRGTERAKAK